MYTPDHPRKFSKKVGVDYTMNLNYRSWDFSRTALLTVRHPQSIQRIM